MEGKFKDLISSCVAIYGFFPPSSVDMMNLLAKEFKNYFLNHGFSYLSYEEFYLAMQLNARKNLSYPYSIESEPIKVSGATVSVKFVSDVMCLYLQFRSYLDRKIQNYIDGFPS